MGFRRGEKSDLRKMFLTKLFLVMYTLKVKIIETQINRSSKKNFRKERYEVQDFSGTGSCVPDYVMDNDGVAELVETSDSWIRERTGIARRHIAVKETTVSMANEAAKRALDNAGVLPEELDLILMSTISSDVIIPCGACEVQKAIGADKAVCFDLNGACTGFVLAYNTALAYIESGIYQTVLIVGSESLSRLTNWKDRGTCIFSETAPVQQ